MNQKNSRAFVISAVSSGAGKTTLTMGIMAALKKRGLTVQPFKAGPDYIDPSYHRAVTGRPSYNLDTWMMGVKGVKKSFSKVMCHADIGVIEGVMGLFDGKDGRDETGSTAHLSKILNLEVILIVDAKGTARSAAALVMGFEKFDPEVKLTSVIFNRVGGERHFKLLKEAVENNTQVKVLGYVPNDKEISFSERHLGLVMCPETESKNKNDEYKKIVELVEKNIDLDALLLCGEYPPPPKMENITPFPKLFKRPIRPIRIAIAQDNAFCFYYKENLDILRELGAELLFFTPVRDSNLPSNTDGIFLGGGYPELHSASLEKNIGMRQEIKEFIDKGKPVYAECGGLMFLGKKLVDLNNRGFDMVGIFPWSSKMLTKRKSLGYREVVGVNECPFVENGETVRGHEFHYSEITSSHETNCSYLVSGKNGYNTNEGYRYKNTLASYIHLHFASNPKFAEGFLKKCADFRDSEINKCPKITQDFDSSSRCVKVRIACAM